MKAVLDDIVEKTGDEFNMIELMAKVPPEERTPYTIVAIQECERMNTLTNEMKRSLKELDLGLKVMYTPFIIYDELTLAWQMFAIRYKLYLNL